MCSREDILRKKRLIIVTMESPSLETKTITHCFIVNRFDNHPLSGNAEVWSLCSCADVETRYHVTVKADFHSVQFSERAEILLLKANFQSVGFSERAEFWTIRSCSAVTIDSISEQHFLSQTKEFPPARKIPLTGNQP